MVGFSAPIDSVPADKFFGLQTIQNLCDIVSYALFRRFRSLSRSNAGKNILVRDEMTEAFSMLSYGGDSI